MREHKNQESFQGSWTPAVGDIGLRRRARDDVCAHIIFSAPPPPFENIGSAPVCISMPNCGSWQRFVFKNTYQNSRKCPHECFNTQNDRNDDHSCTMFMQALRIPTIVFPVARKQRRLPPPPMLWSLTYFQPRGPSDVRVIMTRLWSWRNRLHQPPPPPPPPLLPVPRWATFSRLEQHRGTLPPQVNILAPPLPEYLLSPLFARPIRSKFP